MYNVRGTWCFDCEIDDPVSGIKANMYHWKYSLTQESFKNLTNLNRQQTQKTQNLHIHGSRYKQKIIRYTFLKRWDNAMKTMQLQTFSHANFNFIFTFLPSWISSLEWHKCSIIPGQWMSVIRWHSQLNIGDCRSLTALPHMYNQKLNRGCLIVHHFQSSSFM